MTAPPNRRFVPVAQPALGDQYRILHVSEAGAVNAEAVLEFWAREDAMGPEAARQRVAEVAFVAVDSEERLAAVSSVYLGWSPELRTRMWIYRTFVGSAHRRSSLALALFHRTRVHLEQRFASGEDTRAPGVMFEFENVAVRQARNEAVWEVAWSPGVRLVFIGENAHGDHRRVLYFPGALAPPPDGAPEG